MANIKAPPLNPISIYPSPEHCKIFIADTFFPQEDLPSCIFAQDLNNRQVREWLRMGHSVPDIWEIYKMNHLDGDDKDSFRKRVYTYDQRDREANFRLDLTKTSGHKFLDRFATFVVESGYTVEELMFGYRGQLYYNEDFVPVSFWPLPDSNGRQKYHKDEGAPPLYPIYSVTKPKDVPEELRKRLNLTLWDDFLKQHPSTFQLYFPTAFNRWYALQQDPTTFQPVAPIVAPTLKAASASAASAQVPERRKKSLPSQNLPKPTANQTEEARDRTVAFFANHVTHVGATAAASFASNAPPAYGPIGYDLPMLQPFPDPSAIFPGTKPILDNLHSNIGLTSRSAGKRKCQTPKSHYQAQDEEIMQVHNYYGTGIDPEQFRAAAASNDELGWPGREKELENALAGYSWDYMDIGEQIHKSAVASKTTSKEFRLSPTAPVFEGTAESRAQNVNIGAPTSQSGEPPLPGRPSHNSNESSQAREPASHVASAQDGSLSLQTQPARKPSDGRPNDSDRASSAHKSFSCPQYFPPTPESFVSPSLHAQSSLVATPSATSDDEADFGRVLGLG